MKKLMLLISAVVLLALHSSAQTLTYTSIDVPGALFTRALGINDGGAVVGRFIIDNSGNSAGFLLSGGVFHYIYPSGGVSSSLRGINSQGDMVGDYVDVAGIEHGFLMTPDGALTVIDVPSSPTTIPNGINSQGKIVGNYFDSAGVEHGFIYKHGQIDTFDLPNATFTPGFFVSNNDVGALVGTIDDAAGTHAFLRRNGLLMTFNIPNSGAFSSARAISSTGKIVGGYAFVAGRGRGFLLADGNITRINFPKATSTSPSGINAHDQVVGFYVDSSGVNHGFIAQ
jgi:uncharacterized membrane protein